MAILIKRLTKKVEGYIPHKAFSPITWDYYPLGTEVKITTTRATPTVAWKSGDKGVVTGIFPASGPFENPRDDLYRVKFALPDVVGDVIGHFYYYELQKV